MKTISFIRLHAVPFLLLSLLILCVPGSVFTHTPTELNLNHDPLPHELVNTDIDASCTDCPSSGYIPLSNQQEVDDFGQNYPNCTNLDAFLLIGSSNSTTDISDLTPLNQIETITYNVTIRGNPNLTTLAGLSNLKEVTGNFEIIECHNLQNLQGLDNLEDIWHLHVFDNNGLLSLDGISSSISGSIRIENNPQLADISVLSQLSAIGGSIVINSNTSLTSLSGLENIQSIRGVIWIRDNTLLSDISSLSSIDPATVDALNLTDLEIIGNSNLSVCDNDLVCGVISNPAKSVSISGNSTGCTNVSQVTNACFAPSCTNLTFPLDGSMGIDRDVTIQWNPVDMADFYSLSVRRGSDTGVEIANVDQNNILEYDLTNLMYDSTYFVTITPANPIGAPVCTSESFTVQATLNDPNAMITYPTDGSVVGQLRPDIKWTEIPDIDYYELVIDGGSFYNTDFLTEFTTQMTTLDLTLLWDTNYRISVFAHAYNGDIYSYTPINFSTPPGGNYSFNVFDDSNQHVQTKFFFMDTETHEVYNDILSFSNPTTIALPYKNMKVFYYTDDMLIGDEATLNFTNGTGPGTYIQLPQSCPNYVTDFGLPDDYLFINDGEDYHLEVTVDNAYAPDSIFWFVAYADDMVSAYPYNIGKIKFMDDGQGNDAQANDQIYTSFSIPSPAVMPFITGWKRNENLAAGILDGVFQIWENGSPHEDFHMPLFGIFNIAFVDNDAITYNQLEQIGNGVYINDYIVNIVRPHGPDVNWFDFAAYKTDANILYDYFGDVFDFINYHYPERTPAFYFDFHHRVKNDITGLGLNIFDITADYGSAGFLKGFNSVAGLNSVPPYNHEVMHQWGVRFSSLFNNSNGNSGHWGTTSVGGVLGGEDEFNFIGNNQIEILTPIGVLIPNGGGFPLQKQNFADIELYMMGVLDFSMVRDVFYSFNGLQLVSPGVYQYDSVDTFTKQDIIDTYGLRNPAPVSHGKTFRTATIVVTSEPLSDAGLAFYTYLAKAWEGRKYEDIYLSFSEASNGMADMITELPYCFANLNVDDDPLVDGTYRASDLIQSKAVIQNPSDVYFGANQIILNEDFTVDLGATFIAEYNPCNN